MFPHFLPALFLALLTATPVQASVLPQASLQCPLEFYPDDTLIPAATLDSLESPLDEVLFELPREELRRQVGLVIQRYNEESGYLPGLVPEWNLKTVDELIADLREHREKISASKYYQFQGNVAAAARLARYSLTKSLRNRKATVEIYTRSVYESALLETFLARFTLNRN